MANLILAAQKEGDSSEQKSLQQTHDFITNPFYFTFEIGMAKILDRYSKMSLNAQKLWNFPGTFVNCLEQLKLKLSDKFDWEKEQNFFWMHSITH